MEILINLPSDIVVVHVLVVQEALAAVLHVDLLELKELLVFGVALIGVGHGC